MLGRIEKRAGETLARGEPVRADDNPETLKRRLAAYHAQTAPLTAYYAGRGKLWSLDGMATIEQVAASIDRILGKAKAPKKAPATPRKAVKLAPARAKSRAKAKPAPKRAKKAVKSAAVRRKKPARRAAPAKRSGRR